MGFHGLLTDVIAPTFPYLPLVFWVSTTTYYWWWSLFFSADPITIRNSSSRERESWILNLLVIVNWDPFLSRNEGPLTVYFYSVRGNFIMENAREVVAKITEFPWGQFCLAPEIVCVSLQENVIRNIPSELSRWDKKNSSFLESNHFWWLYCHCRIIGDHFLRPPAAALLAFVTLCEKAISQQIWMVLCGAHNRCCSTGIFF